MANINQLIAQGAQTQGINPMGLTQGVENIQNQRQRNELLGLKMGEFRENAPVRKAERASKIDEFEVESHVRGAKLLKTHLDAVNSAETAQEKLNAMSATLAFLDEREGNISARSGDASSTTDAKNILENFIASPLTGAEDFAGLSQITDNLANMQLGGKNRMISTRVDEEGNVIGNFADGTVNNLGYKAERPDFRYEAVKGTDAQGNDFTKIFRLDQTNRPNADGTVTPIQNRIPVDVDDADAFLSRLAPDQVTYTGQPEQTQTAPPIVSQTTQQGQAVPVTTITSPVSGIAAQETAKVGAKLTEERYNKIITDAPSDTRMAGFIGKLSNNTLDSAKAIKKIITENPTLSTGFVAKMFVDSSGEKQVMRPIPGKLDDPSIQVATLMNQMFGSAAFVTLQEMRAASPTGGALGQVSNFEIDLLKNQMGAFSQESDPEFAKGQIDKIIGQAQLVNDLAMAEIAVQQRIQGLGSEATKEDVSELINAGFNNMSSIYKTHGRDSGTWDDETLTWSRPDTTVTGESNEGKKEALDLTQSEVTTQEQYDALPSGAIYLEGGKTYRKP